ncbi:hypothetical protein ACA910_021831 [Epithemia clementina (nom. ined.)]
MFSIVVLEKKRYHLFQNYQHTSFVAISSSNSSNISYSLDRRTNSRNDRNQVDSSSALLSSSSSSSSPSWYVQQHCNLTGVDAWMLPDSDWRRRVPAFVILGVKKGGTTGLFHSLVANSRGYIVRGRTKELQYFIPKRFQHWNVNWNSDAIIVTSNNNNSRSSNDNLLDDMNHWHSPLKMKLMVQVAAAREALYQKQNFGPAVQHILWQAQQQQNKSSRNLTADDYQNAPKYYHKIMTGEATPDYLMFPKYASHAMFCTIPWVKLIVVLRDPFERLFSHYNYFRDPLHVNRQHMPSFEEWVRRDIQVLQTVGVLPQNLSQLNEYDDDGRPVFLQSSAEREGWQRYQRMVRPGRGNVGSDRHVIRSLYAPQLEEWARQLRLFFGDGEQGEFDRHVKVILSRDLLPPAEHQQEQHQLHQQPSKHVTNSTTPLADVSRRTETTSPQQVLQDLLDWLGVANATHDDNDDNQKQGDSPKLQPRRSMITHYTSSLVSPEFQTWLQETIFDSYNQRLYRFLGPKYQGIFDRPRKQHIVND